MKDISETYKIEQAIIKLVIGFGILGFSVFIRNYNETKQLVEKSNKIGGLIYTYDLGYYAILFISYFVSGILILNVLVTIINHLKNTRKRKY